MNIGQRIADIRKENNLTQEEFGDIFHVTRQTVSNWETEKNYPDLKILVDISDHFRISLDQLLKEDPDMIERIDRERFLGKLKREKKIIDFLTGAGTGLVIGCLYSPDSWKKTLCIIIGILMIIIGSYRRKAYDQKVLKKL
ncbi:helix-turn-helix transcriptional regulator [Mordavella massiliensis]|nr:helix-turn-helix transcriptional regulator [Mordavella massiliensis]